MIPMVSSFSARSCRGVASVITSLIVLVLSTSLAAQEKVIWSDQEKPIAEQIKGLRKLDDTTRVQTTKDLALRIRKPRPYPTSCAWPEPSPDSRRKAISAATLCRK